jgi:formate-dependent nitrite reductase membrane component NrfD
VTNSTRGNPVGGRGGGAALAPPHLKTDLIPPRQQTLWGWPAVVNFTLGGLGAGLYVAAVAAAGSGRSPAVTVASWLGPVLVLAGFAAVAGEAGRPLRGPRVLARIRSSWMSRELAIGLAFVLCAAADALSPAPLWRMLAVVLALLLALAQGFIVRGARGITAWDMPLMPLVFLLSALLSGAGGYLLIEVALGEAPHLRVVGAVLGLLVTGFVVWTQYLAGSRDEAFARAVAPLSEGPAALFIAHGGYLVPFVLMLVAAGLPTLVPAATGLAGALMISAQGCAKARLILAAGELRPITLSLRMKRRAS